MLRLVNVQEKVCPPESFTEKVQDHQCLVDQYFQSHRIRNHSARTLEKERQFLKSWFKEHGSSKGPLYTWEAMAPVLGRQRVIEYGNTLLQSELSSDTVRSYLGILRRYFSFILEFPFITRGVHCHRIQDIYGPIDQPVTEYDMPHYVYEGERLGVPLDPEKLMDFYSLLHTHYLPGDAWQSVRARNYTLAVLAGETGLRADELLHLEVSRDLFFDSHKLQTRFAKGSRGSGKRARITLFPPLSRDSVRYYLKVHRPKLCHPDHTDYLFPAPSGGSLTYAAIQTGLQEKVQLSRQRDFPVASHLSWHWFRRLFATRFIERFPNRLSVLITLLGHTSPNTVHRYIRHSRAWMDKEIQSILEGPLTWPSLGD